MILYDPKLSNCLVYCLKSCGRSIITRYQIYSTSGLDVMIHIFLQLHTIEDASHVHLNPQMLACV